eukprot:CAMPEP_0168507582 /NCGR_PEP_ID=MMETSP0228-20121227/77949_1 /TAXON_ID=133427 /ORGANISM="Protoceratium reticulatum, Strain CCCM 535 (=CCMP 1889)" /LENGTH=289 /DNA_ID=CAMNT_0008524681 /DNA_START=105 /DNA_END=974 /DNA_ORIENTATION=+
MSLHLATKACKATFPALAVARTEHLLGQSKLEAEQHVPQVAQLRMTVSDKLAAGIHESSLGGSATPLNDLHGALNSAELDEGIVGPAAAGEPPVPVVAPLAARPQLRRQLRAAALPAAAAVPVAAVEVVDGMGRELGVAAARENPLPRTRDHDIKAVVPHNVEADVGDLHDHPLVYDVGMGTTPLVACALVHVLLICEKELIALATYTIAVQSVLASDCGSNEAMLSPGFTLNGCWFVHVTAWPASLFSQTDLTLALSSFLPVRPSHEATGLSSLPLPGQAQLGLQQSQ